MEETRFDRTDWLPLTSMPHFIPLNTVCGPIFPLNQNYVYSFNLDSPPFLTCFNSRVNYCYCTHLIQLILCSTTLVFQA